MLNREMIKIHKGKEHPSNRRNEELSWLCDICGGEQISYAMLLYHRKKVHKVDMKGEPLNLDEMEAKKKSRKASIKFLCNLCGKEFSDKYNLDKHVRFFHKRDFGFSCHVCGMGKPSKRELTIHLFRSHKEDPVVKKMQKEEGIRLIKCEVKGCTGVFLKQEELDKHKENKHKDVDGQHDRFWCDVCGKGFYLMTKLRYHTKRVHEKKNAVTWKKPF